MKRVLLVAGEASADMHAANLLRAISNISKEKIEFSGIGGDMLISTGCFSPEFYNRDFAVSGLWELAGHLKKIHSALNYFKTMAKFGSYDLAVLLDYPDFNIPLAKFLHKKGVPVIYYISPQVWVWRSARAYKLAKYSKDLFCIFPFEKDFYKQKGIDVEYLGHPLIDEIDRYNKTLDLNKLKEKFSIKKTQKIIAVLPGSRHGEIKYILPVMEKACRIIKDKLGDTVRFLLPLAPTINDYDIISNLKNKENIDLFEIVDSKDETSSYDVYSVSDHALLASGTATVEAGLFELPMSIVYKVSKLSAFLFKHLIRYKNPIGMVNLLLKQTVANEFFQNKADPQKIAEDIMTTIFDEKIKLARKKSLKELKKVLYTGESPSLKLAKSLLKHLKIEEKC
jgi:lipid-A-disaccharide synthase